MRQGEQIVPHDRFTANHLVSVAFRLQIVVSRPTIRSDRRGRFHAFSNGRGQIGSRSILDHAQANAAQGGVFVLNWISKPQ